MMRINFSRRISAGFFVIVLDSTMAFRYNISRSFLGMLLKNDFT